MKNIPMCFSFLVFTGVGKTAGCAIVTVGNEHAVFDQQGAYFLSMAMGQIGPFLCHFQIGPVVSLLFFRRHLYLIAIATKIGSAGYIRIIIF